MDHEGKKWKLDGIEMKRVAYLSLFLLVLLLLYMNKIGFFDPRDIRIDSFEITKPIPYKYIGDKHAHIVLDDSNNYAYTFSLISGILRKSATFFISKQTTHALFDKTASRLYGADINVSKCNVIYDKGSIDTDTMYFSLVAIASYPYMIQFSELDKKRENTFIHEVCTKTGLEQKTFAKRH